MSTLQTIPDKYRFVQESDWNIGNGVREPGMIETDYLAGTPHYKQKFLRLQEAFLNCVENPTYRNRRKLEDVVIAIRTAEAHTTDDFPLLFGDVLEKAMRAEYARYNADWQRLAARTTFRNFRKKKLYDFEGASNSLDRVSELGEYKERSFIESKIEASIRKYGNILAFSMELFIEDDLDAFANVTRWLALGASTTRWREITSMLFDASGPNANFFTVGNGNILDTNPPLSYAALEAAWLKMSTYTDASGEPIPRTMTYLIVPPALTLTATQLINATGMELTVSTGAGGKLLQTTNPFNRWLTIIEDPYIPVIASTANGNTSWVMMADPGNGRPALYYGVLAGREEPELFQQVPDQRRLGGGTNDRDGDFMHDAIRSKIRMFFGTAYGDPKMVVGSNGSGS